MSTRSKAQASVTYYDSVNFSSSVRTAIVNWVNAQATALNADATPKAYARKFRATYTTTPAKGSAAKSEVLQAEVLLTDSAKWDSTTRSNVVSWLQAIAAKLTADATPKSFKRVQTFTFSR